MLDYEKTVLKPVGDVQIKVDFDSIPEYQRDQLAELALDVTRKVFAQPSEEERYQIWLAERNRRHGKI